VLSGTVQTHRAGFDAADGRSVVAFQSAGMWRVHVVGTDLETEEAYTAEDWEEAAAMVEELHARLQSEA